MTQEHKEMIEQFYNACSQEQKDLYDKKVGIYGIYVENKLVYIGKSTNLLNRWIAHKCHVFCPSSKEYNRPIYSQLRQCHNAGLNISINLLEFCDIDELNQKEREWIGKYQPYLNSKIPNAAGGEVMRGIIPIFSGGKLTI